MKRIHIGLEVRDLERSIEFYSALFGGAPTVQEDDYAKWMSDDPRVNFSISSRGDEAAGSVHFGVQVEEKAELGEFTARLGKAGEALIPEDGALCCYHKSEKVWVIDPDALRWETFYTSGRHTEYGENFAELEEARLERLAVGNPET